MQRGELESELEFILDTGKVRQWRQMQLRIADAVAC